MQAPQILELLVWRILGHQDDGTVNALAVLGDAHQRPGAHGQPDGRIDGRDHPLSSEQLRRDERAGRTISEVAWRVLNDHVIAQHERVALAKLPDDTFRFRREAGRLRFFDKPNEYQRNSSRFGSLSSVCAELGWMGFIGEPGHALTAEGEQIRQLGDLGPG